MARILIVDDDAALREGIAETLADLGHASVQAADGATGLARVADGGIDAVLLDLRMPGLDGMEVLRRLRGRASPPPVAVLTAVPTATNTIEAMRLGAVDHLAKPIGRAELAALIARMLPDRGGPAPASGQAAPGEDLVGGSPAMREVQKAIGMLADMDATVLITGETGTGKEVVARAIHRHGRRAAQPFVAVNCAAIPADLLESQLFGHVRGAFTGAVADRAGSFREADRGTLFLDEIGDMDAALQAKLLRVLQERVVTPGRRQADRGGCPHPGRDASRPRPRRPGGIVPRGSVLAIGRGSRGAAAAARAPVRHPAACRAFPGAGRRRRGQAAVGRGGRAPAVASLAGQRPRVAQRDGAGRRPGSPAGGGGGRPRLPERPGGRRAGADRQPAICPRRWRAWKPR